MHFAAVLLAAVAVAAFAAPPVRASSGGDVTAVLCAFNGSASVLGMK